MSRPAVDVVVPFRGDDAGLGRVEATMQALALRDEDTLTIVDNGPFPRATPSTALPAPERASSYFARNRGAAAGSNPWIVFLDADTHPEPGLLDALFDPPPDPGTAVLAGAVIDSAETDTAATRFQLGSAAMSQDQTAGGDHPYAQTANAAFRRDAFEAAGGFRDDVRSGGDAELCFRLAAQGLGLERRESAGVTHAARPTVRALLRQKARHGAGAAWVAREHPGTFPRAPITGLLAWSARSTGAAVLELARGDARTAGAKLLGPAVAWSYELGRLAPNKAR